MSDASHKKLKRALIFASTSHAFEDLGSLLGREYIEKQVDKTAHEKVQAQINPVLSSISLPKPKSPPI